MIKENELDNLTGFEDSDWFRAVSSSGASKKVTGEVIKTFLSGEFIIKVDDYYYFQDPDNPENTDYRIHDSGIYLKFVI